MVRPFVIDHRLLQLQQHRLPPAFEDDRCHCNRSHLEWTPVRWTAATECGSRYARPWPDLLGTEPDLPGHARSRVSQPSAHAITIDRPIVTRDFGPIAWQTVTGRG
jgi:hypothetical protein